MHSSNQMKLYIRQDKVNSVHYVMMQLIQICGLNPYQAEQCAILATSKNKVWVKTDNKRRTDMMVSLLTKRGIVTEVEAC